MTERITVSEAARNLAEYVDRVARGERFLLMRDSEPVAELAPVRRTVKVRDLPELFASLPRLSRDEATDFGADIERARSELPPPDPVDWPS